MATKAPDRITIRGPGGIMLTLDRTEVFPDDPGNGTPCIVRLGHYTGTLAMASCEGVLNQPGQGDKTLTEAQCRWLNAVEEDADAFTWDNDDMAMFRLKLKEK